MQFLARLMDHALAQRGERSTIVVATSGDTGGAAVEAFRGRDQVDVIALYPHGRISEVQRRMMTTPAEPNVHALAIEGTFDDCQAIVKGLFNHHAFRDRVRLSGVNSINWARIVAQVVYYFTAAVALGAPHRKVAFTVPTGNFGDVFAGYVAQRMGLPIERLTIATNVNDILVRTLDDRHLRGARRDRDHLALDGHPGLVEFRAAAVRRLRPRPGAVRALMGSLAQSRQLHDRAARARRNPRALHRRSAPTRRRPPRPSARCARETGYPDRSAHRGRRSRSPRRKAATARCRWWCCRPRIRRNSPTRSRPRAASRPRLPDWLGDLDARPERVTRAAGRPGRGRDNSSWRRAAPRAKELPHEHGRDPPALRPRGRHRRDAASGKRLARRLGRLRQPRRARRRERHLASARAHGVQGHGAPHRAADRRGDRGGRRRPQRRDQRRDAPPITRACCAPTCRSRSTCCPTS